VKTVRQLAGEGILPVPAAALESLPPPRAHRVSLDRVEGMLLGLAIGDALGNTSEGLSPRDRRRQHGEIRDYLPNRHAAGRAVGLPSDDTQLAFWTLECLLADGRIIPERLAEALGRGQIFGIGHTVARLPETMPSALYIVARHGADAETAIVRAVNDTQDNDTIGAIVGALVGALHGRDGLSRRWRDGLLGRTAEANDGRIFELITEACRRWS
jgi:ADP-ribosylglycohydrolase